MIKAFVGIVSNSFHLLFYPKGELLRLLLGDVQLCCRCPKSMKYNIHKVDCFKTSIQQSWVLPTDGCTNKKLIDDVFQMYFLHDCSSSWPQPFNRGLCGSVGKIPGPWAYYLWKTTKKCTFLTFSYFHIMQLTVRCYISSSTLPVLWPVWQIAIMLLHDVLPGKICVHIFRFQIVWRRTVNENNVTRQAIPGFYFPIWCKLWTKFWQELLNFHQFIGRAFLYFTLCLKFDYSSEQQ